MSNLCVSQIASTGGFLHQGRSTLLIGVEEAQVDEAIQLINVPPQVVAKIDW